MEGVREWNEKEGESRVRRKEGGEGGMESGREEWREVGVRRLEE